MLVFGTVRFVQEWPGLNCGIIPQHSFHPTHGSTLVDNDISLWQIQTNRQFHVGREVEMERRIKKRQDGERNRERDEGSVGRKW